MKTPLQGSVLLPGSKSESNRALMIAAYGGFLPTAADLSSAGELDFLGNCSTAHDTVLLRTLLAKIFSTNPIDGFSNPDEGSSDLVVDASPMILDCEDAGTVARFLLPLLCGREGSWILTGGERLCQRPMAPLVGALRQLGADIVCLGEEGYLPLKVRGRSLNGQPHAGSPADQRITGGAVTLDGSQSSQFVSALLMAAPTWERGLQLEIQGTLASQPYVAMTVAIMRHFGAEVQEEGRIIKVAPKPYAEAPFEVGADWSAASYWYELLALSEGGSLMLKGLRRDTLQGDAIVASWYEQFGVQTRFEPQGAVLTKVTGSSQEPLHFDFRATPDLFPAMFVTCVALHRSAVFTGIRNLSLKESERVTSIVTELSKLYTFINIIEEDSIIIESSSFSESLNDASDILLDTYQDHRIAMALAPLRLRFPGLRMHHPEVVGKSYPGYWGEFEALIH